MEALNTLEVGQDVQEETKETLEGDLLFYSEDINNRLDHDKTLSLLKKHFNMNMQKLDIRHMLEQIDRKWAEINRNFLIQTKNTNDFSKNEEIRTTTYRRIKLDYYLNDF